MTVPGLRNTGSSLARASRVVRPKVLVALDGDRAPPGVEGVDRDDLLGEHAGLPGGGGAALGPEGEAVLLLAGHGVALGQVLGRLAHGLAGQGVHEAVGGHGVLGHRRAHPVAAAHAPQQVRGAGHVLHADDQGHVELAEDDRAGGQGEGLGARPAGLVDRVGGTVSGTPGRTDTCRAGLGPLPAWRPWPATVSSTSPGSSPAASSAARAAAIPRSTAGTSANAPMNRPIGVRLAATMTTERCSMAPPDPAAARRPPGGPL